MNKQGQLLISQLTFNQVERRNICWEWYRTWFTTSMFWILVHTRVKGFRQKFKVQFKEYVGKTIEWELTEKVLFILLLYRTYNETCTACSRRGRNILEVEAKNVKCLVLCIIIEKCFNDSFFFLSLLLRSDWCGFCIFNCFLNKNCLVLFLKIFPHFTFSNLYELRGTHKGNWFLTDAPIVPE